jgi:hypothetical protein
MLLKKTKKQSVLQFAALLLVAAFAIVAVACPTDEAKGNPGETKTDYTTDLTWGTSFTPSTLGLTPGNTTTELYLNWYSAGAPANKVAKVRFIEGTKEAGTALIEATGAVSAANTPTTSNTAHKAKVTGLKPGASYVYSVCTDDTNWSEMYNYKAPAAGAFKFAIVADPQLTKGNVDPDSRYKVNTTTAAGWVETMGKIVAAGVSFIASGGDQVDATTNGDEVEYENFFAPTGLRSLPFAPVPGNHDRHNPFIYHYNLPNLQTAAANLTFSSSGNGTGAATTPEIALVNMGNYFYRYNNVLFVVLNTAHYPNSTANAAPYIEFFRATLTAAKTAHPANTYDWLIVQHHKSTASVGDHAADWDIQWYVEAGFETLMSEFNVDFVLAGHDHVYARSYPLRGMDGGKVSVPDTTKNKASGSTWTGVSDPIYLTFTTGSGLKYYSVAADKTYDYNNTLYVKAPNPNPNYPYLGTTTDGGNTSTFKGSNDYLNGHLPVSNAAYVQPYIPSYGIVEVNGRSITFSTYPIATVDSVTDKGSNTGRAWTGADPWSFNANTPYDKITVTK